MKVNNIELITTDYFEYEAVSSSFLYKKECELLHTSYNTKINKESESIVLGNIIDKYIQDKSIRDKIVYIPVGGKGYEMWRYDLSLEEIFKLDTTYTFSELKEKYEPIYNTYWSQEKKRWNNGRNDEERQICEWVKKRVYLEDEIMESLLEYNEHINKYSSYFYMETKHLSGEIILLNKVSNKPDMLLSTIDNMIEVIDNNVELQAYLKAEEGKEIFYQFAVSFDLDDVHCKALPDIVVVDYKRQLLTIIDVKTTRKKTLDSYKDKRYFRQLAFYGLPIEELYPDLLPVYAIFQIRENKLRNVTSKMYYISPMDIITGKEGGMLKLDFQSHFPTENEDVICATNTNTLEVGYMGILPFDKRYKIYGIEELIQIIKQEND